MAPRTGQNFGHRSCQEANELRDYDRSLSFTNELNIPRRRIKHPIEGLLETKFLNNRVQEDRRPIANSPTLAIP